MTSEQAIAILGIVKGDSMETVNTRRRLLVLAWHPDRFESGSDAAKAAEEELKKVNAAYDVVAAAIADGSWHKPTGAGGRTDGTTQTRFKTRKCKCGRSARVDYSTERMGEECRVSELVRLVSVRVKGGNDSEVPLLLLTYNDQEVDEDHLTYGGCTHCVACNLCGKPINADRWVEKHEQLVEVRGPYKSDWYWYATSFEYIHEACLAAEVERRNAQARREAEAARVAAEKAEAARRMEQDRREREGLCLRCGEGLRLGDRWAGRLSHKDCKNTASSRSPLATFALIALAVVISYGAWSLYNQMEVWSSSGGTDPEQPATKNDLSPQRESSPFRSSPPAKRDVESVPSSQPETRAATPTDAPPRGRESIPKKQKKPPEPEVDPFASSPGEASGSSENTTDPFKGDGGIQPSESGGGDPFSSGGG